MKKVLTIAGSDSGGGAGIQADLKTFSAIGTYGMSAITALTAQNTVGVQGVVELDPKFVGQQIDSVATDIGVDAVKIGMLSNELIVKEVAEKIKEHGLQRVVLDPVMVAKGGDHLLKKEAVESLKEQLIPLSEIVTPNLSEAEVLTGMKIKKLAEMKKAARMIHEMGANNVVVKGGHLEGDAVDLLYNGTEDKVFSSPRIKTKNNHGTGCTFAAALASYLAKGNDVPQAVEKAKQYITEAIRFSLDLGKGHGPTNHFASLYNKSLRYELLQEIKGALEILDGMKIGSLIPQTQSNLALALPYAVDYSDVAAVPGRLIRWEDSFKTLSGPAFGTSKSMASVVLMAMEFDRETRAAMNIRYSKEIWEACQRAGFSMIEFSWPKAGEDPPENTFKEAVARYFGEHCSLPDMIYSQGGWGKEAHIEFFGKNAFEITEKIKMMMDYL